MSCQTCVHWDQRQQREELARFDRLQAEGFWLVARQARPVDLLEWGDCDQLHTTDLLQNQTNTDQWWDTPRQTHETFGCVLYEAKP